MLKTLVNVSPIDQLRAMDEMFDRMFAAPHRGGAPALANLPVDILEQEGKLLVKAAVPGVAPENLDISIENDVLSIRGESRQENETKDAKVYRREVSYGSFARSIRLPQGLDLNAVDAEFNNGFVTITIPRQPEEKPKAMKVNVRSVGSQGAQSLTPNAGEPSREGGEWNGHPESTIAEDAAPTGKSKSK